MRTQTLFSVAISAGTALALPRASAPNGTVGCPITFDGRVPVATEATFFDNNNAIFSSGYVKGNDLKWSDILKFPTGEASRFDGTAFKAVEVTLSDKSIFQQQKGFRRAGLQFASDSSSGPGNSGIKTLHWSVKLDPQRAFNLTHEYLNVWHETADYSADQIMFQTGQIIGKSASDKNNWKILDRNGKSLYSVAMDKTQWQNFAITLDYNKNQVKIYYSAGKDALKLVANNLSVNLAGNGQFQLGILKKPTGTSDVVNSGYQESNLNEGLIYGGLFLEDSSNGCVSL